MDGHLRNSSWEKMKDISDTAEYRLKRKGRTSLFVILSDYTVLRHLNLEIHEGGFFQWSGKNALIESITNIVPTMWSATPPFRGTIGAKISSRINTVWFLEFSYDGDPYRFATSAHIDHVRKIAGVDHVGIGAGYDGINLTPAGLEDVSKYPELFAELLARGWLEKDIQKLAGLNLIRVFKAVEKKISHTFWNSYRCIGQRAENIESNIEDSEYWKYFLNIEEPAASKILNRRRGNRKKFTGIFINGIQKKKNYYAAKYFLIDDIIKLYRTPPNLFPLYPNMQQISNGSRDTTRRRPGSTAGSAFLTVGLVQSMGNWMKPRGDKNILEYFEATKQKDEARNFPNANKNQLPINSQVTSKFSAKAKYVFETFV
ncbi:Dipeptidase 1 [Melipona quadrifasciata]|uniref:Dipeptidase n=1 Tax=Melipona quadrifasciata TaxID=166423 RepID=A0A0M8ZTL6_9HYME|nr:Dipeptidase 1 [Melipona quadrifasciata]